MSVPEKKLVTLSQLQMQAERIKSELDKYALEGEMQQAVEDAVAQANICTIEVVDAVPETETASENVLYLYHNTGTGKYEIYALVDTAIVRLDDDGGSVSDDMIATDTEVSDMLDEVFPQSEPEEPVE